MESETFTGLSLLLKASSKDVVQSVCQEAFLYRNGSVPDITLAAVANALAIEPVEVSKLFSSARVLVTAALQAGLTDVEAVSSLLPDGFHSSLKMLLSEIIVDNMSEWRSQVLAQQVSLPRLEWFDWRVDVKTSSTCAARMAIPTCLLQMKVYRSSERAMYLQMPTTVCVEFSKETLHTMLDGLGRIQDQLASVAAK